MCQVKSSEFQIFTIAKVGSELIEDRPYPPDRVPIDYLLFPKRKEHLDYDGIRILVKIQPKRWLIT